MPRRSVLTPAKRIGLLAFLVTDDAFVRHYIFSVLQTFRFHTDLLQWRLHRIAQYSRLTAIF